MNKLIGLLEKYKSVVMYLFFGVCTTIINIFIYNLFYFNLYFTNVGSTIIAWIGAVLFAFITNKLFVFESKSFSTNIVLYELIPFLGCRLATGVLDLGIMFITVDCLQQNALIWKIISNFFVIIINYIASKFVIFK